MGNFLNPAIIARGAEPAKIESPLDVARSVREVQQLGEQAQLAPLRLQQATANVQQTQLANQEGQLALKKTQEDREDQQTFRDSLTNNLKPDGSVDWDKAINDFAVKGQPRNIKAFQDQRLAYLKGQAEATQVQRQNTMLRNQAIGNATSSLLELPEDQRLPAYTRARQQLIDQKFIDPNDPEYPENPPDLSDKTLRSHLAIVGALSAFDKEALAKAQTQRQTEMATRVGDQAKTAARQDKINQAVAGHLGVTNQEQHSEWLENLDPDIKPMFQNYQTFDPSTPQGHATAEKIQEVALTANQRFSQADRRQRADAMTLRAKTTPGALASIASDPTQTPEVRQSAKDALQLEQKTTGRAGAGGVTGGQLMVQARNDEKEANTHKDLEGQIADLYTLKARYKNGIQKAAANGQDTMKDPKTGRDMSVDDATTLMNGIDNRATILHDKADDIMKRHQWGKYTPALPAASANPNPAVAQTPSATTKTFPRSRIAEFAAKQPTPMSPQQAEAGLKAKGYTITEDQPAPPAPANQ